MKRSVRFIWAWLAAVLLGGCSILPTTLTAPITTTDGAMLPSSSSISLTPSRSVSPDSSHPTTSIAQDPLVLYVVELINSDRAQFGLDPVILGNNSAAQIHAQDMFDNYYLSHWGTDGLKPYVRYTLDGGINYEGENSAYSGWYDRSVDPRRYATIDPRAELKQLEYQMMYDDAESNWGHRDNILNKWHKRVNIGISYDTRRLTLVEQFEGDYVQFTTPPGLDSGLLSVQGNITLGTLNSVAVFYDPLPQPMTQSDLLGGPRSYRLGTRAATIIRPPPPGYYYSQLPDDAVQASIWEINGSAFSIGADLKAILQERWPGVYTIVAWSKAGTEYVSLTNYSLLVR